MPELPEVEVVRAGLSNAVTGSRVTAAEIRDPRALKRHAPIGVSDPSGHGVTLDTAQARFRAADFERRVTGRSLFAPQRRGKFLWIPFGADEALLAHLGMSGQLLLRSLEAPDDRFVRARLWIEHPEHGELRIDFADQRLFGSLAIDRLAVPQRQPGAVRTVPSQAAHIAPDPLESEFQRERCAASIQQKRVAVKRVLLDQSVVSGIGNIYADEALWAAQIHPETPAAVLSIDEITQLLDEVARVFHRALAEGGTSFDAQYVNVNGQAGYFAHSLNAYGREGEPCARCGEAITRIILGGRSAHFCAGCQRPGHSTQ